jgi:hypothetical protein
MRNFIDLVEANLKLRPGVLKNAHGAYGAFIVVMRPSDFLELTTSSQEELAQITAREFPIPDEKYNADYGDLGLTSGRFDMPFLYVQFPSGKIVGHEGRHRAAMILASGGKSFPVMIYPRAQDQHSVVTTYSDEDWNDHEVEQTFDDYTAATDHESKVLMQYLKGNDPEGLTHQKTKIKTLRGDKLRGAPDRSSGWQYAAWKVSDFPAQLVSQYSRYLSIPTNQMKIGIVKGYSHHREPEA